MINVNNKLGVLGLFYPEVYQFSSVRDFKDNNGKIIPTKSPHPLSGRFVAIFENYLIWNSEGEGLLSDLTGTLEVSLKSPNWKVATINEDELEERQRIYPELIGTLDKPEKLWLFRYYNHKPARFSRF